MHSYLIFSFLVACCTLSAAEITFGPVRLNPGQRVDLLSRAESEDGRLRIETGDKVIEGGSDLLRVRDLSWIVRSTDEDGTVRGMVDIREMKTISITTIDGKVNSQELLSPLNGTMLAFAKPPGEGWKIGEEGAKIEPEALRSIAELTSYLNRKWYPEHPVKIGDTWEFDPVWIRMIVEKDLPNVQTIGTMKLRRIEHTANTHVAFIDVKVISAGAGAQGDQRSKGRVELSGEMRVNLRTMLDESLVLKGVFITEAHAAGQDAFANLPVEIRVSKTVLDR